MSSAASRLWGRGQALAARLLELCGKPGPAAVSGPNDAAWLAGAEAVVTHIEINDRHGVGVLLLRLFCGRGNLLTVRSQDHFGGRQPIGDVQLKLAHGAAPRPKVFESVLRAIGGHTVARILAVPYYADDARTAVALQAITGAPMCTYLMDDQNLEAAGIPDEWMAELLAASRLRLAISPELAAGYEAKYGLHVWWMPPLVEPEFILSRTQEPLLDPERPWGVILGNIWSPSWLEKLRRTVRDSGVTLRWYAREPFRYFRAHAGSLKRDSILVPEGAPLEDGALVEVLRAAPFAVVPSGTLDADDDRQEIARFSLPSRIPFLLAAAHTPVLVLGHPETAAARFVTQSRTGLVCSYESGAFRRAVAQMLDPEVNRAIRRRACELAPWFSARGALDWIWRSAELGRPADGRFEHLRTLVAGR